MALLLVVDDEMGIRELVRTFFLRKGHEVLTTPHVDQALDFLAKRPVDLVILDAHFPTASGLELVRKIRLARNPVPIIVYSGDVPSEEGKEFCEAGATEILIKGGSIIPLAECVSKILKNHEKSEQPNSSPRTILVTDDDANIRRILKQFLESRHFTVREAASGREAVEAVRSRLFAAVFLDVRMPGELDGITALREIRLLRPELSVIMVSAEQDDATVNLAVELGAAGYVVKPFDFLYLELLLVNKITAR